MTPRTRLRRAALPLGVFAAVLFVHFLWLGLFPERDPALDRWASAPAGNSWWQGYVESQGYWLGFSYALALSFAGTALRRYREDRLCAARTVALGSVTLSGFLAVVGCYLIGCCGSPMLAVYLGLFGTAFLPLAKPLVAALTTASVLAAWWWMKRQRQARTTCVTTSCASSGA